jgi:hypothetical protein
MEKFARRCNATGCGMNEGYVVGEGDLYFSGKEHLIEWLKGVAIEDNLNFDSDEDMMNHYHGDDLFYYTEWDDIYIDDIYYDEDGNEYND